jgi:hypothetical protein
LGQEIVPSLVGQESKKAQRRTLAWENESLGGLIITKCVYFSLSMTLLIAMIFFFQLQLGGFYLH